MVVDPSRSYLQSSLLKINQTSGATLQLEELPVAPLSPKKNQITLHEGRRRENLRKIDEQNARFAKKLMFVNSSIPAFKTLNKEFNHHKKTKQLRCKWPIVNMKKNVFNQMELSRKSSDFSMRYENTKYETSPVPELLVQTKTQNGLQLNDLSELDPVERIHQLSPVLEDSFTLPPIK